MKKGYKDLEIYQLANDLAIQVHKMTLDKLPKFEMFEEGGQIRRSSKSIVSTIIEGYGRKHYQQEYIKFLTYALSSVDETKGHLEMLFFTGSLQDEKFFYDILEKYNELGRKIFSLRAVIQKSLRLEASSL